MATVAPQIDFLDPSSCGDKSNQEDQIGTASPRMKQDSDMTDITDESDEDNLEELVAAAAAAFGEATEDSAPLPPSPSQPPRRRRSALKNNYSVKDIPVCTKRRSYSVLPPPCMKQVEMRRVESMTSLAAHQQAAAEDDNDEDVIVQQQQQEEVEDARPAVPSKSATRRSSKVNFQKITIREYDQTLGDNPSVSYGPPISLDWNYEERATLDLEEYEGARPERRKLRQMGLSYYQRRDLLITEYGHTMEEVKKGKKEAEKISRQRAVTRTMVGFLKVEDILESAGRKMKRAVNFGEKNKPEEQPPSSSPTRSGGEGKKNRRSSSRLFAEGNNQASKAMSGMAHSESAPNLQKLGVSDA